MSSLAALALIGSSRCRDEGLSAAVNLTHSPHTPLSLRLPQPLHCSPQTLTAPPSAPLVACLLQRESRFKALLPLLPFPAVVAPLRLLSPEEVSGIAGISQHPRGAPTS